jgi:DNA-binding transcriptional regulator YdaS (Cro superfamily)
MSTSASAIASLIASTAAQYGVDPNLAVEVGVAESNLNQNAVSSAGAIGVMQLMPATAAALGVDPTNLAQNIQGGCMLLAQLNSQFNGDVDSVLAAYNWGSGNVTNAKNAYGSNWLAYAPSETQNYVSEITNNLGTEYNVTAAIPGATTATSTPSAEPSFTPPLQAGVGTATVSPGTPYGAIAWGVAIVVFAWLAFAD